MGQVTVTIAEKIYRIACNDGQEPHLVELAAELDIKIGEMRAAFGEIGDSRLTVMACITYMDEREDLKKRVTALEEELAALKISYKSVETSVAQTEKEIADAIITAAGLIEEVAKSLASGEIS